MSRSRTLLFALVALAAIGFLLWLAAGGPDAPTGDPLGATTASDPSPADTDPDLLRTSAGGAEDGDPSAPVEPHGRTTPPPQGLTGEVHDERGRGLTGATVEVRRIDPRGLRGAPYPDGPVLQSVQTERDGTFAIPAVSGTWLRVLARAPGRARAAVLVASTGASVVLVLPPAGTLAVEVVDEEGRPVPGAQVDVQVETTFTTAIADAAGRAVFEDAAPGALRVRASAAGHGPAAAGPFLVGAGATTTALVRLPALVRIAGIVRDATGRALPDAEVHLARPGESVRLDVDAQGRFGPVAGGGRGERVFLAAAAEGYAPVLEPVILRAVGDQAVVLVLEPATPWKGRVVDARGAPVPGATVGYTPDGASDGAQGQAVSVASDDTGRFTLPPPRTPAPGRRVVLSARKGDGVAAVALRPGMLQPEPLILTLRTGTVVSGRAVDAAGRGVAGAIVRLAPSWGDVPRDVHPDAASSRLLLANEEGFPGLATATGPDGSWMLGGIPAGPFVVHYEYRGVAQKRDGLLEVADRPVSAGTEVLGGGRTVLGQVVDDRGRPVPGAHVTLLAEGGAGTRARTTTDLEGAFEVSGLGAAAYDVVVTALGRAQATSAADLTQDTTLSLRIALDEPAGLTAEITREGAPYRGIVTLTFADTDSGRAVAQRRTVRVTAGRLEIGDAPRGSWTVDAFAGSALRARAEDVLLEPGRTTAIRLDLMAGAELVGTVLTPDGAVVAGAYVTAAMPSTGTRLTATTSADGRFRFENIAPGSYALEALGRGGAPTAETIGVEAGAVQEVALRLAPAGTLEVRVLDESGKPVAEARLTFLTSADIVRTRQPARTDRAGVAIQPDLPVGEILVRARGPDGRVGEAQASVAARGTTSVELHLAPRDG